MKQQSLAAQSPSERYGRKSRRELFLDEMERVVPWPALQERGLFQSQAFATAVYRTELAARLQVKASAPLPKALHRGFSAFCSGAGVELRARGVTPMLGWGCFESRT